MKIIFLTCLATFSCLFLFSQEEGNWILFHEESGVKIFQQEVDCMPTNIPNQIGILIKVINENKKTIELTWELEIWYNHTQHKTNIKDGENEYKLVLAPNHTIIGDCETPNGPLYIFKEFTTFKNGATMTQFKFENINISKVEE